MSAVGYTCCSECGKKLRTTFFCQGCGQPSCSLDCYCRHLANHSEAHETAKDHQDADASATRLEPAR